MPTPITNRPVGDTDRLAKAILEEVEQEFLKAEPRIPTEELENSVRLLLRLIQSPINDSNIANVGRQIESSLTRCLIEGTFDEALTKSLEPFLRLLLSLIDKNKHNESKSKGLGYLLKSEGLDLCTNDQFGKFAYATQALLANIDWSGEPFYVAHLARVYVRRNDESHRAINPNRKDQAAIVCSFCVILAYAVHRYFKPIDIALFASSYEDYLRPLQTEYGSDVEQTEDLQLALHRGPLPLSVHGLFPEGKATDESLLVPGSELLKQPERLFFVVGGNGAGKSTLLKKLASQHAMGLLQATPGFALPIYLDLDLLTHRNHGIQNAIMDDLDSTNHQDTPWDRLLILVDGIDRVGDDYKRRCIKEIRELIKRHPALRAVVASRHETLLEPNLGAIWELQPLTDEQIVRLIEQQAPKHWSLQDIGLHLRTNQKFLAWIRTPLHAHLFLRGLSADDITPGNNWAMLARRCIRRVMEEVASECSVGVETVEAMLASLAFEMMRGGGKSSTRTRAVEILILAKDKLGAAALDVPRLIDGAIKHRLLRRLDEKHFKFSHDLYLEYLAATELESRDDKVAGSGIVEALGRFHDIRWLNAILYFAALTEKHGPLIRKGTTKSPLLGFLLWDESGTKEPELAGIIADSAFETLESKIKDRDGALRASHCLVVLAALGRADYVRQGLTNQSRFIEAWHDGEIEENIKDREGECPRAAGAPFFQSLYWLIKHADCSRSSGDGEALMVAANEAINILEHLKAWRVPVDILAAYNGTRFFEARLVPGRLLAAIVNIGVDPVIREGSIDDCNVLVTWLKRACEAGFSKAWRCYGRAIRLLRERMVDDALEDNTPCDDAALVQWLRQAHASGETEGSLELARWLLEEPHLQDRLHEALEVLHGLEAKCLDARRMLGEYYLSCDGHADKATGLELLFSAAAAGDEQARYPLLKWWCGHDEASGLDKMPDWARSFSERFRALMGLKATG